MQIFLNIMIGIIAVLLLCSIMSIHEFGHFIMAKLFGVKVNEFSVGMGPLLLKKKKGETQYSIRLLPIGGYCSMEGEDEASDDPRSFSAKPAYQRAGIAVMGAVFNVILGFIIMLVIFSQQAAFTSQTISQFQENSTTQATGLQVNDTIVSIDGYNVRTFTDLNFALGANASARKAVKEGGNVVYNMTVLRNGKLIELPSVTMSTVGSNGSYSLQLDFKVYGIPKTFPSLIKQSFNNTLSTIKVVWFSIAGLVSGKFSLGDMSGPVGIVSAVAQTASQGLEVSFLAAINNILFLMAMITVNLGVLNLLPFPALDGGRLIFMIAEMITRKRVPEKYEQWIHAAGFAILILFMLVVTFSDVMKFF